MIARVEHFLRTKRLIWVAILGVLIACTGYTARPDVPVPDVPLLSLDDLVYEGAFRVPTYDENRRTFKYGGYAPAFNSENNSLFLVGHRQQQLTAEIEIPSIVASDDVSELETARFLQPFSSATRNQLRLINPNNRQSHVIGGQYVHDGQLFVNAFSTYDARGTQNASLFIRDSDLLSDTSIAGPFRIGSDAHMTSAYLGEVPPEWQLHLGGTLLAGNCCRSIISHQSWGPALSAFDLNTQPEKEEIRARSLLEYPSTRPLGGRPKSKNEIFNLSSEIEGVVFPPRSRSVLFFGRHGIGEFCYGEASACGDRAIPYKGNHAYPYVYQVWAYDALDLVAVSQGRKSIFSVNPYDIWTFRLPFERDGSHSIGGVAFDPATNRLYISQLRAEDQTLPIIHVFKVTPGT